MSRAGLAEVVTAYLHREHRVEESSTRTTSAGSNVAEPAGPANGVESGSGRVLGAASDAELGLFKTHPRPSGEEPLRADQPGGGPVEAADWWVAGTDAPPVVSLPPVGPPRVVLHWAGRWARRSSRESMTSETRRPST
jgi:hypothetical protein